MTYGYCRISKPTQSIDRQVRNIQEFDSRAKLIKEAYTGTTQERPAWLKLRKNLKAGDTVNPGPFVWSTTTDVDTLIKEAEKETEKEPENMQEFTSLMEN